VVQFPYVSRYLPGITTAFATGMSRLFLNHWGVGRAFDKRDCCRAILLVIVALAGSRDKFVIRSLQVPPPLPRVVFEHYVLHIAYGIPTLRESRGGN
jgi:hypothetical protein